MGLAISTKQLLAMTLVEISFAKTFVKGMVSNLMATGRCLQKEAETVAQAFFSVCGQRMQEIAADYYCRVLDEEDLQLLVDFYQNPKALAAQDKMLSGLTAIGVDFNNLFVDRLENIEQEVKDKLGYIPFGMF